MKEKGATIIVAVVAMMMGACATAPRTYQAPDAGKMNTSRTRLSQAVTKAHSTAAAARAKVFEAQLSADKTAKLSGNVKVALADLEKAVPAAEKPQVLAALAQEEDAEVATASLRQELTEAVALHEQLNKELEEAETAKTQLEKDSQEYLVNAQKLAAAATAERDARIKDEKSLHWYRWHWWGSWIVLGLGVLACGLLAFLKFTGRLAIASAPLVTRI